MLIYTFKLRVVPRDVKLHYAVHCLDVESPRSDISAQKARSRLRHKFVQLLEPVLLFLLCMKGENLTPKQKFPHQKNEKSLCDLLKSQLAQGGYFDIQVSK